MQAAAFPGKTAKNSTDFEKSVEFFGVLAGEAPGDDRVGAALAAVPNAAACILSGAVVFFDRCYQ